MIRGFAAWLAAAALVGCGVPAADPQAQRGGGAGPGAAAAPVAEDPNVFAALPATPPGHAVAVLAGGCFWCVEADFDALPGVVSTTSGYAGGHTPRPSYRSVASGRTGHAEAVWIVYDPKRLSYAQLLAHFWRHIDPTVSDRQFCDVGSAYRAAVFVLDGAQQAEAEASRAALQRDKPFAAPVVTEITRLDPARFYPAEVMHQDYHRANPLRYRYYRHGCRRDARLEALWGPTQAPSQAASEGAATTPGVAPR